MQIIQCEKQLKQMTDTITTITYIKIKPCI